MMMEERDQCFCTLCQGQGLDRYDRLCTKCQGTGLELSTVEERRELASHELNYVYRRPDVR